LGDFYRRRQTPDKAGPEYRQAVQLRQRMPEEPEYLARLIRVLLKLEAPDELDRAAALAEKLVGLQPEHAGYQTLKARVALDRQDFDGCIRLVESLPNEDATSAGAERLFLLAMARHQRGHEGDRSRARQDYDQALEQMQRESAGDMAMIELRDEAAKLLEIAAAAPDEPPPAAAEPKSE